MGGYTLPIFSMKLNNLLLHFLALLGAVVIGLTLYLWGQPLICTCGYVDIWVGSIFSSGNSQHIADWYTLSHMVHGMLVVLIGRLFFPHFGFFELYLIAILTGVAWELIEHTDFVLDMFRDQTLYQGYRGDSVLNAVADYLWMLGPFFVAYNTKTIWIIFVILVLEVVSATQARDSLILTTITVIYPIEVLEKWQQEINPTPIRETN